MTTLIQWTHLQNNQYQYTGVSNNPLIGCRKISSGCNNCYAVTTTQGLNDRFGMERNVVNGNNWNGNIFFSPKGALAVVAKNKQPKAYFVCSMSDFALGDEIDCKMLSIASPDHPYHVLWEMAYKQNNHPSRKIMDFYRDAILAAICYSCYDNPSNKFLILTKRPEVLKEYLEYLTETPLTLSNRLAFSMAWLLAVSEKQNELSKKLREILHQPHLIDFLGNAFKVGGFKTLKDNVWLGTTVESSSYLRRIDVLQEIPWGQKKFISAEPLLSKLEFLNAHKFDWLILGGESGGNVRKTELKYILDTIKSASNLSSKPAIFVKQLGKRLGSDYPGQDKKGGNFEAFPPELQRREFPEFE